MVGFTSPKLQQWRGIDDLRLQQVIDIKKASDFLIVKNKWLNTEHRLDSYIFFDIS